MAIRWLASLRCLVVGLGLACVLAWAGCTPDFDDISEVRDLRILAMRATPPELLFGAIPTNDAEIPEVQVDALVVDPRSPGGVVSWRAAVCTAEGNDCSEAAMASELASRPGRLGTISFSVRPSIDLLVAALAADPFKGFGGLPLLVEIQVDDAVDGRIVRGVKRIVYTAPLPYSPVPADKVANRNPQLESVRIDDAIALPGAVVQAAAGQKIKLEPMVSAGSKESYVVATTNPAVPTRQLDEYLVYRYFAAGGSLSHSRTGGAPSPFFDNKKVKDISAEWDAPAELVGPLSIWVVVDDGRGGVDWTELRIEAAPAP